jgi:hypothetical protein
MIVSRILRASHKSAQAGICESSKAFKGVVRVIIESGLIYTAHSLLCLVVATVQSYAFYPVTDSVSISFVLSGCKADLP